MARGRINGIDLTDEDREALRWWRDAKPEQEIPGKIWDHLTVHSFITRKTSDEKFAWKLTQTGVRAMRQIRKESP